MNKKFLFLNFLFLLSSSFLNAKTLGQVLFDSKLIDKEIKNNMSTVILINNTNDNFDVYYKEDSINEIDKAFNNENKKEKEEKIIEESNIIEDIKYINNDLKSKMSENNFSKPSNIKDEKNTNKSNVISNDINKTINEIKPQIESKELNKTYNQNINSVELINKIKSYIEKGFQHDFSKELFYKELNSLSTINNSVEFKNKANSILTNYFHGEMKIENKEVKNSNIKKLEYLIENQILYINPNSFYDEIYLDLKNAINSNKYKYNKIVINLENIEGGSLNSFHRFMNSFLMFPENKRVIFTVKTKNNYNYFTNDNSMNLDILTPIDIKINNKTKLGALMSAKVLEHFNRVKIIGKSNDNDKSLKTIYTLNENNDLYLKIPTAEFYIGKIEETKNPTIPKKIKEPMRLSAPKIN